MRILSAAASAVFLAACSVEPFVPDIDKREFTTMGDLLYSMECELAESVKQLPKKYKHLANQKADVHLKLKVVETPSSGGDIVIGLPVGF